MIAFSLREFWPMIFSFMETVYENDRFASGYKVFQDRRGLSGRTPSALD
jgi:hypothetical protein